MKRWMLWAALLMLLCPGARGEAPAQALLDQTGFSGLVDLSEALDGPDVRRIAGEVLSGRLPVHRDLPGRALRQFTGAVKKALLPVLWALATPVLVTLALRTVLGAEDGPLVLLCRLACVFSLGQQCAAAMEVAREGMAVVARIANAAAPVIASALSLTGRAAASATLTPVAAVCADGIEKALMAWGLPMCVVAAVIAAGGSLSDSFRLDRLFKLICGMVTRGLCLLIAAFVGLMALQGRLAAARDGASVQAVRQALKGLIPLIGGSIGDSSAALLESAAAVRNAVGVTGLMILLGTAAGPAVRLGAHMLSMKLASALMEPVADPGITRIAAGYGEIARLQLALYTGSVLLAVLLTGAGLGLLGF